MCCARRPMFGPCEKRIHRLRCQRAKWKPGGRGAGRMESLLTCSTPLLAPSLPLLPLPGPGYSVDGGWVDNGTVLCCAEDGIGRFGKSKEELRWACPALGNSPADKQTASQLPFHPVPSPLPRALRRTLPVSALCPIIQRTDGPAFRKLGGAVLFFPFS